jgi:hypothetical protein
VPSLATQLELTTGTVATVAAVQLLILLRSAIPQDCAMATHIQCTTAENRKHHRPRPPSGHLRGLGLAAMRFKHHTMPFAPEASCSEHIGSTTHANSHSSSTRRMVPKIVAPCVVGSATMGRRRRDTLY